MVSRLIIRPASVVEHAEVLELWRESREASGVTDDLPGFGALLEHDPGALPVAELGDRLVGYRAF